MGNCLKTQLKEVVNNDNLSKMGEFTFKISGRTVGNIPLNFNPNVAGKSVKLSCADGTNCLSMNQDGSNPTSTVTKTVNTDSYLLANTPLKKFVVENKYDILRLSVHGDVVEDFNVNEFDYNTELESFALRADTLSPKVYGDINKMIEGKTPFNISIQKMPNVKVNVNTLGSRCQRLSDIRLNECNISGTVQGYVNAARQVLSSGEIYSSSSEWHLNDGTVVYTKPQGKIKWTANTITIEASSGDIVLNE